MENEIKYTKTLELYKVLAQISEFAASDEGKRQVLAIMPCSDIFLVEREMGKTSAAHSMTLRYGAAPVARVQSCEGALKRAEIGASLGAGELLGIMRLLNAMRSLGEYRERCEIESSEIDEEFYGLFINRDLEDRLRAVIISEDEIADDASDTLLSIRRRIKGALASVREQLEHMVRSQRYQSILQESVITQRDGRFVVPVKVEYKNEVKGIIHDTSSSGATVFIEPAGVVEENNRIRLLEREEQNEIARILLELSVWCGEFSGSISAGFKALVKLDVLFAKAAFAKETNSTVPVFRRDGGILLKKARHPLIDKGRVVPIDINLGVTFDTMVITGPNTGGKTVALKTLGLLTLMGMCAIMIPASDGSELSVYENVLPDIGDEQSIEQSLSTFSSHMVNLVSILALANRSSLVLVDELGAGTDPTEGAALAVAILESLRAKGARVAATTHYAEVKMFALETDGVENACCEFDVATLRPTYRLLIGVPGRSNAFLISERLGLNKGIIESARNHVASDSARFEEVVAKLEESRQGLESERREQEESLNTAKEHELRLKELREDLESRREKELERARREADKIVSSARLKTEELLNELSDLRRQKEAKEFSELVGGAAVKSKTELRRIEEAARLREQGEEEEYKLPRPLMKGDSVKVVTLGQNGVVLALPDSSGNVLVQTGTIKTRVNASELRLIEQKAKTGKQTSRGAVTRAVRSAADRSTSTEFDMRGMNAEEGIMELERFIDSAGMLNIKVITIIHGKGTGVLRQSVHTFLKRCRQVRTYRLGVFGEGENGVTIAELK